MRRRLFGLALALGLVPVAAGIAVAAGGQSQLADARQASAAFHDLAAGQAAGYTFELPETPERGGATCIVEPGEGAMGVHMVNVGLLDGTIDPAQPEVLVYEPRGDGLKLVAVEYVVFEADWAGSSPPELFGRRFDHTGAPNRYGLPPFYALHAWLWKPNPSGLLEPWNPKVSC